MKKLIVLLIGLCAVAVMVSGCKWRDDFRSRVQPQHRELDPEPTFNEDSVDYVGDERAKGFIDDTRKPNLESIDDLSEIPELPDSPNPIN